MMRLPISSRSYRKFNNAGRQSSRRFQMPQFGTPNPYPNQPQTYQYQNSDQLLNYLGQQGVSHQQVLNTNPGGYPFSVGQTIKIPNLQPTTYGPPKPAASPYANQPHPQANPSL